MNDGQCRELILQLGKELKMMEYLREHKNYVPISVGDDERLLNLS